MNILLTLLIIAVAVFIAFWIIDKAAPTGTINMIAKVVVGVIALAALLTNAQLV